MDDDLVKSGENLPATGNISMLPKITKEQIEAMEVFYDEVKNIVVKMFKLGYHYGPFDGKPGKKNILYKQGANFFINWCKLLFEYSENVIDESNGHYTLQYAAKMYRVGDERLLSTGMGSCSTAEGRFSYKDIGKVDRKQVREQAQLRARKDAIEIFFNPSRYFDAVKEVELKKWKPKRADLENLQWYLDQTNKARTQAEIKEFLNEFDTEIKLLTKDEVVQINDYVAERWKVVK